MNKTHMTSPLEKNYISVIFPITEKLTPKQLKTYLFDVDKRLRDKVIEMLIEDSIKKKNY